LSLSHPTASFVSRRSQSQKREVSRKNRLKIARRQKWHCNECFKAFSDIHEVTIDHIEELQDGGKDVEENLQALCFGCHRDKNENRRLGKKTSFVEAKEKQRKLQEATFMETILQEWVNVPPSQEWIWKRNILSQAACRYTATHRFWRL
jgi:5-methylcytosine-specific restriction endonuclease McrA